MIGIVVPAHNEQAHLNACLTSLSKAAVHPGLQGEDVRLVVVLDACADLSSEIVARHTASALTVHARNVGVARAAGAEFMLKAGARWLAFTDADSIVAADWLVAQLAQNADAVCGIVSVDDWSFLPPFVKVSFEKDYVNADGHNHIHGANLGVSAAAYRRAGGFQALPAHEDVHLVRALEASSARIAWTVTPKVVTSARLDSRAPEGFGGRIKLLVERWRAIAECKPV